MCENINKEELFEDLKVFFTQTYVEPGPPSILFQMMDICVVPEEIEEILSELEPSFSERLMEIIRERGLNEVEVYKKADIDRRVFSKLRTFSDYRPRKDTAILLCMSMQLSYEDTADLLARAGFAFSKSSKTDVITEYFFRKGIYDIPLFKQILFKFGALSGSE